MGSICAQRAGGCPGGSSPPSHLEARSHLFLCVHGRIYIPPALLLSLGSARNLQQADPLLLGPAWESRCQPVTAKEEAKVTPSSEQGQSGSRNCPSILAMTLTLGSGPRPGGGRGKCAFPAPEAQIRCDLLIPTGCQALCWELGMPPLSSPALEGLPCTKGSAHQDRDNNEPSWAPSSTVYKAPSTLTSHDAPPSCGSDILQRSKQDPIVAKNKDSGIL